MNPPSGLAVFVADAFGGDGEVCQLSPAGLHATGAADSVTLAEAAGRATDQLPTDTPSDRHDTTPAADRHQTHSQTRHDTSCRQTPDTQTYRHDTSCRQTPDTQSDRHDTTPAAVRHQTHSQADTTPAVDRHQTHRQTAQPGREALV